MLYLFAGLNLFDIENFSQMPSAIDDLCDDDDGVITHLEPDILDVKSSGLRKGLRKYHYE